MIANPRILTDGMVARIESLASRYPTKQALTLPALHIVHDELRHVPLEAVVEIANLLDLARQKFRTLLLFTNFFTKRSHTGKFERLYAAPFHARFAVANKCLIICAKRRE